MYLHKIDNIRKKHKDEKSVLKAQPVCRGFEEENLEEIRKDSPTTCGRENFHLVVAILSAKEWAINSLDIKSAFLQGMKSIEMYCILEAS